MGMTEQELASIGRWRESDLFSELDRLALQLAEAMSVTPADVSEDLRRSLAARLTAAPVTELAAPGGLCTSGSKTTFPRAVRHRYVAAVATPLHAGRTVIVIETDLFDADGKRVAKVIQSQAVLRCPAAPDPRGTPCWASRRHSR